MKRSARHVAPLMILATTLLAGCGVGKRPLQVESVPNRATIVAPRFKQVHYRPDRDENLLFVAETTSADRVTGRPVKQVLLVRVFWIPKGGKTSLNPTSLNATFRYLVMTPTSAGQYEGAGFVRIHGNAGDKKLRAEVQDSDLRLTEATAGYVDTLGRSRLRGTLDGRRDDAKAIDGMLAAHQEFFHRTLAAAQPTTQASAPGTPAPGTSAPAAQPATQP